MFSSRQYSMQTSLINIIGTIILCLGSLFLQAQSFTITSDKESGSCGNQQVTFAAGFVEVGTTYSFNSGTLPNGWASSPYHLGQACSGVFADRPDGSDYFWATLNDTNGYRFVSTKALDISAGGEVTFSMRFGRDDPSSGCENPDEPSEGVYLQYSTDGGAHWVTFKYWVPHQIGSSTPDGIDLYRWNEFTVTVPDEAKTSSTRFRWFQPSNSGSSYDNWGLDDISVFVMGEAHAYAWEIGDGQVYQEQTLEASFDSGGDKIIYCTVTDAEGNTYSNSINFEVVIDNEAPLAVAKNYFLILDKEGQASLIADYLDGGSTDNCSELYFSVDKEKFSCTDLGDNIVTLSVTDNAGNVSTASATVSIYDFTAPLVVAQDITVQLDETGTASISPEQIDHGSADACSATLTLSLNKSHFTQDDLGKNTVILTAKDESGNQTTARAIVTVEDKTAPSEYTVAFEETSINTENQSNLAFSVAGAEAESTYAYTISSNNGGVALNGNGKVSASDQLFSAIDASHLPDGELKLSLTLTDKAGNTGAAATATASKDTSSPMVNLTSSVFDPTSQAFLLHITFSEPVSGFSLEAIALTNASASDLQSSDQRHFTAYIHPVADGLITMEVAAAVATDRVGNPNQAVSSPLNLTYDGTAPRITISTAAPLVNTAFDIYMDFDEVVSGFTIEDMKLINGTATELQTENHQNFTVRITPTVEGMVSVHIAADVVKDAAGNGNQAALQSLEVMYDASPPVGYALHTQLDKVNTENMHTFSFQVEGLEVGAWLSYSISSSAGGFAVEGNKEVEEEQMTLSGLNLADLADGELTFSFYLVDKAGNQGENVVATTQKSTVAIVDVETFSNLEVPFATAFEQLSLPHKVAVTYSTGEKDKLAVEWNGANFSATQAGVHALEGKIQSNDCINTQNLKAQLKVKVGQNVAPTQLYLSATTLSTDITPDQAVGRFTTQDADDHTHSYTLESGEGDGDNASFMIIGDELFLTSKQEISGQTNFSIRVRSSDAYGNFVEETFTLFQSLDQPQSINFVNTFSPNGDGINEVWIVPDLQYFNEVNIEVFDRSGRRVFQTTDPGQGWDGRVNGSIQNEGFYYIITIKDIQLTKRGVLSVIK